MPSPFPGMDPYLENPSVWADFHHTFIAGMRESLAERLFPRFFIAVEKRVYISDEGDPGRSAIVPDVSIIHLPEHATRIIEEQGGGGVEVAEPIVMQTLMDEEIEEARLEILDVESRTVVTVIEVISPANKIEGARGRQSYRDKRVDVMNSPCHLVEIDLLRTGRSFIPAQAWSKGDYFAHVSRAGKKHRPSGVVWPIRLRQRLPIIDIPLTPDVPDVKLNLQAVLSSVYDRAKYSLIIDYHGEPTPPLIRDQQEWSDQLLKRQGFR